LKNEKPKVLCKTCSADNRAAGQVKYQTEKGMALMKEFVALVGPYDENAKKYLTEGLKDFNIIEIGSKKEYPLMTGASYIILRSLSLDRDDINAMENLKLIQRWGVGYDTVDIKAAEDAGVTVAIASGVNAIPVAEFTVLLMLSIFRNIMVIQRNVKSGKWKGIGLVDRSYVVEGKTVGLIGLGAIGKAVAKKTLGLGAKVIYHDMKRLPRHEEEKMNISYTDFDTVISSSDIISLHLPLNEKTKNLINKEIFSRMKRTAVLINTSRGGIVNENDLFEALQEGKILGAGLDVFECEPVDLSNPLLSLDNVVVSAHCAGNTADNSINMAKRCVCNIKNISTGKYLFDEDIIVKGNSLTNIPYRKPE
jgi:lactate dehydrogenase-like 2-hydroxyacid dehydrogenase